uniref:Nucleotid_trans domain-containing protein n=1 Tax=Strongyloides papillosus TaxID=174720 RepID=A0A0N5BRN4_STREA
MNSFIRHLLVLFLILLTFSILYIMMVNVIDDIYFDSYGNINNVDTTTDNLVNNKLYPYQIAIIMVIANGSEQNYEQAIETVKCYSWHYNYTFVIIRQENVIEFMYNCYHFDFMFLRHCIIANYAEKYKNEIKYVVFIDSDIGVVSPMHKLENYLPKEEEDILFYDRIFNSEIAAGSYIIRNTLLARSFLKFFADYEYKIPENSDGSDNVALQAVFVDFMGTVEYRKQYLQCMKIYDYAVGYAQSMLFVSCMRYILSLMDETPNDIDYHGRNSK